MDRYLEALATSALPFDVGIAASIWGVLFVANHLVVARARATNDTQSMIALQGSASLRRGSQPMFVLLQVVVAAFVFAAGAAIGGVAATFFIGGQLVAVASNLGLNVQSLAAARTLASQQGVDGSLVAKGIAADGRSAGSLTADMGLSTVSAQPAGRIKAGSAGSALRGLVPPTADSRSNPGGRIPSGGSRIRCSTRRRVLRGSAGSARPHGPSRWLRARRSRR